MAEAKASKWEILDFIDDKKIITAYDLMNMYGYTYSYAYKKLSLLKKQDLVRDFGNTPLTRRGQWYLTEKGRERLRYLCRKLGVLTRREKNRWLEWVEEEQKKPWRERRIWFVELHGVRIVKEGEHGITLDEAKEAAKLNRRLNIV